MYMVSEVSSVSFRKTDSGYMLVIRFCNGVLGYVYLSSASYRCHPDYIRYNTVTGFWSRPRAVNGVSDLSYEYDSSGHLLVDLPTCSGYVSKTGKWLYTGSFHRLLIIDIDSYFSSLTFVF